VDTVAATGVVPGGRDLDRAGRLFETFPGVLGSAPRWPGRFDSLVLLDQTSGNRRRSLVAKLMAAPSLDSQPMSRTEPLGPSESPARIGPTRVGVAPSAGALAPTLSAAEEEPEITRRLRAQYAEVSQLAGGLAHEIRNPLSTVSLNLDLLAEDFQKPETPRDRRVLQRVQRLQHEVNRLSDILENFLRFARVQDLGFESADLNAIVDELRDFYEPTAATKGIVIRTYLAADLPSTRIDADLFKQALLNLVLNAEHAMPSGGELILTTRNDGPWIVLDVIDTGVGMADEVRARIFDAFFSTRPAGSGLGLPTARKIIEAHGGSIQVQSEPGKGSQFTIRLPVFEVKPLGQRPHSQGVSPHDPL
jgi:two-component system sensor histidine kinase HydH